MITNRVSLPWWTLPARMLDRLRPGLAERAAEDAAFLARFPATIQTAVAAGVIAIPLIWAAVRAGDTVGQTFVTYTMRIQDVYIESIPFMVIAAAIGIAAPTLGVLFLTAHVVGDLGAGLVQRYELSPLPTALLGRLISFWLLYVLVAELPMLVHEVVAMMRSRLGSARGVLPSVAAGAGAATVLALAWGVAAPLLIRPVFTWSDLRHPTANAGWPLLDAPHVFALAVGIAAAALLALRYILRPAADAPITTEERSQRLGFRTVVFGTVVPILLFASLVSQPIDLVVILGAVLAARPISAVVLRSTGLAVPLSIIPRAVRLVIGLGLAAVVSTGIVAVLGISTLSDWFSMVVAMGVSFIIVRTLLDAEDFVSTASPGPAIATGMLVMTVVGLGLWLFTAGAALADNITDQGDGYGAAAAAGGAAAGAGGLAAAAAGRKGGSAGGGTKPKNPTPWWMPDSVGPFFGHDGPTNPPPPPDNSKPIKPKGPKPPPDNSNKY